MVVRILENTDHDLYTVKDGIVVIKKGAVATEWVHYRLVVGPRRARSENRTGSI